MCLLYRVFITREQILKCLMPADHWKWQFLIPVVHTPNCTPVAQKKQKTNSNLPVRQKSSWADSYHQAEAVRSHWYGVIEGFRALGRITGLEMIARFNRPLKQKGNTSTEKRGPFAPPIDLLLPSNRPLDLHLESAASVSLWAKSPPQHPWTEPIAFSYYIWIFGICQSKLCWPEKPLIPPDWRPQKSQPPWTPHFWKSEKWKVKLKNELVVPSLSP